MEEYKIIKQTGTAVKSQQNFEDLINSYAKMKWKVVNMFSAHFYECVSHLFLGRGSDGIV